VSVRRFLRFISVPPRYGRLSTDHTETQNTTRSRERQAIVITYNYYYYYYCGYNNKKNRKQQITSRSLVQWYCRNVVETKTDKKKAQLA
jgi:hypothetical protein